MSRADLGAGEGSLTRSWSWHAGKGAVIWQLMFPERGVVAGLKRSPATRTASLFCLEAPSGCAVCDDFTLMLAEGSELPVGEGWMIGLETTHGGLLFCHSFQPGSPEHQGLWAVDLAARRVVWGRPEAVFAANLGDALLVYRTRMFAGFPEREYWLIDPRNGDVVESLGTGHERPNFLRMSAESEESRQGIALPEARMSSDGPVEVVEVGVATVEGRHMPSLLPGAWRSTVRAGVGGVTVHEGIMAAAAPAPLFNNFLVRDSVLYYIRENEELVGVMLP
ncbi:MAG: hypothetical protein HGB02_03970 [Chlorobiaceae bacterium]|nr:hypothetical protein [Chlorobiaceae bacterium]